MTRTAVAVIAAALTGATSAHAGSSYLWSRPSAHLAATPGGSTIATWDGEPYHFTVVDRRGDATRVRVYGKGVQLALWIDPKDVIPSVVREAGVAASETGPAPGPGADGRLHR